MKKHRFFKKRSKPIYKKSHKKARIIMCIVILFAVTVIILYYSNAIVSPTVIGIATTQSQAMSTLVVNRAVTDYLKEHDIDYNSLVTLDKGTDGQIIAVQTDMNQLNSLKAEITTAAQEALLDYTSDSVAIPMGNFTGIDFLAGYGPYVNMSYETSCSANSDISGSFESAGINQVLHKITLEISTSVYIMIPGNHTTANSDSTFCIAETVIVGLSPDSYANLTGDYMNGPSIV